MHARDAPLSEQLRKSDCPKTCQKFSASVANFVCASCNDAVALATFRDHDGLSARPREDGTEEPPMVMALKPSGII